MARRLAANNSSIARRHGLEGCILLYMLLWSTPDLTTQSCLLVINPDAHTSSARANISPNMSLVRCTFLSCKLIARFNLYIARLFDHLRTPRLASPRKLKKGDRPKRNKKISQKLGFFTWCHSPAAHRPKMHMKCPSVKPSSCS